MFKKINDPRKTQSTQQHKNITIVSVAFCALCVFRGQITFLISVFICGLLLMFTQGDIGESKSDNNCQIRLRPVHIRAHPATYKIVFLCVLRAFAFFALNAISTNGTGLMQSAGLVYAFCLSILAQVSRRVTVRLNTSPCS